MIRYKILHSAMIFLLVALASSAALGQGDTAPPANAVEITTDDALQLALSNNLDIKAGLAALETARAQVASMADNWDPRVTASYSYTRLGEKPVVKLPEGVVIGGMKEIPMGALDNYALGLNFIWPIYTGGEREANMRTMELAVEGLEAQQQVLEDITGVLAQHYCLSLVEARKLVDVQKKGLEYVDGLLTKSQEFFDSGLIPRNDLLRIQVERTNRQQELAGAENMARYSEDQLNSFIGFDFGTAVEVEVLGYEPFFFEAPLDPFYQLALKQRPEMKALELQYQVLEEQRRAAKSGRLPDVTLVVTYDRKSDAPLLPATSFANPNTFTGTVQVTYDISDGGKVTDKLKELDKRQAELDLAKSKLQRQIYLEIEQAYLGVKQAYGDIKASETAITQADENLRISRLRFEEGLLVANDVIEAETLSLAAQLGYYHALYNYYRSAAYVGKAVGVADIKYYLELKDKLGL